MNGNQNSGNVPFADYGLWENILRFLSCSHIFFIFANIVNPVDYCVGSCYVYDGINLLDLTKRCKHFRIFHILFRKYSRLARKMKNFCPSRPKSTERSAGLTETKISPR